MTYFEELILKSVKQLNGKLHTSSIGINKELLDIPQSSVAPFDRDINNGVVDLPIYHGFRHPSASKADANLFTCAKIKNQVGDSYRGRIGTYYGITEKSYSDYMSTAAVQGDLITLTHSSFDFESDGVEPGDMLLTCSLNADVGNAGIRKISTVSGSSLTIPGANSFGNTGNINSIILKLEPVQLFTVPSSGVPGKEQVFLTVDPVYLDESWNTFVPDLYSELQSDYKTINQYRIYPLLPAHKNKRADGVFYRVSDKTSSANLDANEWGYGMVLYPALSDGSGPDLTNPIIPSSNVLDDSKLLSEQDIIVDYRNGVVTLTVSPQPGSQLNPNSYEGPIFKLWAVYAAYTLDTYLGLDKQNAVSNMLFDFPSNGDVDNDNPAYIQYNTNSGLWRLHSGRGVNANSEFHGIEVGYESFSSEVVPSIIWDITNSQWSMYSQYGDLADSYPVHLVSGYSGINDAGVGVNISSVEYEFKYNSTRGGWYLTGTGMQIEQDLGTISVDSLVRFKHDSISHGCSGVLPVNIGGDILFLDSTGGLKIRGLDESTDGVTIEGYTGDSDTVNSAESHSAVSINSFKIVSNNGSDFSDTENIFSIKNNNSNKFILKGNGDCLVTGSFDNYDNESDALACQDMAYVLSGKYNQVIQYNRDNLEKIGVMSNGYIHVNNLIGLMLGAIGESYKIIDVLCGKLGLNYAEIRTIVRDVK
jgi:hypothetical protein